jgi:hypothetical protein
MPLKFPILKAQAPFPKMCGKPLIDLGCKMARPGLILARGNDCVLGHVIKTRTVDLGCKMARPGLILARGNDCVLGHVMKTRTDLA